jgi:hypothetical protein
MNWIGVQTPQVRSHPQVIRRPHPAVQRRPRELKALLGAEGRLGVQVPAVARRRCGGGGGDCSVDERVEVGHRLAHLLAASADRGKAISSGESARLEGNKSRDEGREEREGGKESGHFRSGRESLRRSLEWR